MRKHFDFYGYNAPTWGRYYHDDQTYFLGEDFRSVKRYKEYKNIAKALDMEVDNLKSEIKKLVIAIDTSGSVKGETVESFIRKTYSILNSTDFFKKSSAYGLLGQCKNV